MKSKTLIPFIAMALALVACSCASNKDVEITEVWITMEDGVELAADIYWPAGADKKHRYPVLLEYLPYRKDESRGRNYSLYSYFLDHDYVVARVDMRGTGRSEGTTIPYEYSDIELDDGEAVIDWLSKQEWSTGSVGMFGASWGGFNSIQMAMRNPPALKAFVAMMATEYLYQEDVHYMDGIMHTDSWMMSNDLFNALPGAPDFILDEEWVKNRFNVEPSVYTYMRQQRDGPFWDRASARGQYEKIKVPGYHIGGWYDGYRNSLPRMLENVDTPVKALIGPWDHDYPHNAWHEPRMEWRFEAVRWFDHWLKDEDTGILEEPDFAVYVRNYYPPDSAITKTDRNFLSGLIAPTSELITNNPRQPRIAAFPTVVHHTNAALVGPFRPETSILTHSKPSSGRTSPISPITPPSHPFSDHALACASTAPTLQGGPRSLSTLLLRFKCRKILSTTACSTMKAITFISHPHDGQAMQKRAEKRKGKGKPSYWEMKIDYIALREAKNPELRRMLEPMAVTPEPPTP